MAFPGAGAQVYVNEAGEPLGWDYPAYDESYDYGHHHSEIDEEAAWEMASDESYLDSGLDIEEWDRRQHEFEDDIRTRAKQILKIWREEDRR